MPKPPFHNLHSCVALVCVAFLCASSALSAPPLTEKQRRDKISSLARESSEAFANGDHARAETALRQQLEISPADPVASYNLACVIGAQKKDAVPALTHAINSGYDDIRRMKRDPFLAATVVNPSIQSLFKDWSSVLETNLTNTITRSQKLAPKSTTIRDETLKIAYLSSFDTDSTNLSKDELTAISRWATSALFPSLADPDQLALDPWVLLVLPNRQNFNLWAADTYGTAARGSIAVIGGAYDHDQKRLVAQDLGSTLRHEFMHVLHWRDMTRRGQTHPIWLQEGLCSLAEDYDLSGDLATGTITPAHSWRTNAVVRLARNNKTLSLRELMTMTSESFSSSRPLASYAQSRTLFMYLLSKNKLREWYKSYCETFNQDSTGFTAFSKVLSLSEPDLEKDYRRYIRSLNEVNENVPNGGASMGVEVSAGNGEGPVISMAYGHALFKTGDILLTFNRRPVRDIPELVRLLSLCQPGDQTAFTLRRGKKTIDLSLPLVAK